MTERPTRWGPAIAQGLHDLPTLCEQEPTDEEDEDYQKEREALADELDLPINDPRLDEYIAREQGLM
jgi:hypothetical protein